MTDETRQDWDEETKTGQMSDQRATDGDGADEPTIIDVEAQLDGEQNDADQGTVVLDGELGGGVEPNLIPRGSLGGGDSGEAASAPTQEFKLHAFDVDDDDLEEGPTMLVDDPAPGELEGGDSATSVGLVSQLPEEMGATDLTASEFGGDDETDIADEETIAVGETGEGSLASVDPGASSEPTVVLSSGIDEGDGFDDEVEVTEFVGAGGNARIDAINVEAAGDVETDEVFVILPEEMGGDVPVVETEIVEDDFAEAPTEYDTDDDGITEIVDDELDQFAEDLDDDVLGGEVYGVEGEFDEIEHEALDFGEAGSAPRSGGRRWLASLAAALVLGVAGFYLYTNFLVVDPAPAEATGASVAVVDPLDGGENPVTGDDSQDTEAVDPQTAAKEAAREFFRGRVTLALNLGFQVEESND